MVIHELSHQTSDIHEMTLSTVIIDLHKVDNLNSLYFLYIYSFKTLLTSISKGWTKRVYPTYIRIKLDSFILNNSLLSWS